MKKLLVILLFALLCISATSCMDRQAPPTPSTPTEALATSAAATPAPTMPEDFDFVLTYGVGGKNVLDTYKNKFKKDLVMNGTATINYTLPDEAKREIYASFLEHGVYEMPELLNETEDGEVLWQMIPAYRMMFTYTVNGITRSVNWPDGVHFTHDDFPDRNNEFILFVQGVEEYIAQTEEYNAMPPARGGYL